MMLVMILLVLLLLPQDLLHTMWVLFQLPIEHEGKTAGYWPLSKVAQMVMHTNLRSLKLIIIDEVSMLSNLNLAYIHLRLEELFGGSGDEYFGSMNMLFVGRHFAASTSFSGSGGEYFGSLNM